MLKALLDEGTFRELLDPFARVMSPWLVQQNIVPQADDGVVIAKGTIQEQPVVLISIEGLFQGGSLGEVGGAKIAGALELAVEDNLKGIPTAAIYCWKRVAFAYKKQIWVWLQLLKFRLQL